MRTIRWCSVLLIAVAVTACAPGVPVERVCRDAPTRYFPIGSFTDLLRDLPWVFPWKNDDGDLSVRGRYSLYLSAMQEPPLSCGAIEDAETYRFLLIPSFQKPAAVRIYRRGIRFGLEAVVLDRQDTPEHTTDGMAGYGPGKILRRVTKDLSPAQWQSVLTALRNAGFWRMTTGVRDLIGIDGADFIIEARREGRYHVVNRHGGDEGTGEIGDLFLKLAGLPGA